MARFYGIPNVTGPEFRRVDLTGNHERSGILTQASILTVSSYATRTSPVLRGKWILENILNTPPPPPPPDVPSLDVAEVGTSVSLRQQMEKHRANPICAGCHGRMDPLGFSLENYDAVGAWRSHDGKFPIDASGKLPDGALLDGAAGFILLQKKSAFARCVTEKLLIYGLGRGLERYDRPVVAEIAERTGTNGFARVGDSDRVAIAGCHDARSGEYGGRHRPGEEGGAARVHLYSEWRGNGRLDSAGGGSAV
jgi:hypothetical protein